MAEELDQSKANETWTLIHKSQIKAGLKPLGGKWVYKVKRDVHGDIARCKAKWVVKGYLQQFRVDFNQTFVLVQDVFSNYYLTTREINALIYPSD